ncbi:MAG: ADP-glyceromanno-heptose 6-epimerase [Candidatus Omnitrophota bacterium]
MRVILTGGAGFIGSCLLWKLNQKGVRDIIVVDHMEKSEKWKNLVGRDFEGCLEKDKFLKYLESNKLKGRVDLILHIGACTSTTEQDKNYLIKNNYLYSQRMCKWALKNKVHFLYASSAATYGDGLLGYSDEDKISLKLKPLNLYGVSKHMFDQWLIKNKLTSKVTGFKFFNVFGPNEYHKGDMKSVIARAYSQVNKEGRIRLFKSYKKEYADGEQMRDFVYVKDAVEVVNYFIEHPGKKGIFNLGTGKARTWNDLACALFAACEKKPRIEYIPMPLAIRDKYQYFTQADLAKLRKAGCRHKFYTLEKGVKDYAGYLKNNSYL